MFKFVALIGFVAIFAVDHVSCDKDPPIPAIIREIPRTFDCTGRVIDSTAALTTMVVYPLENCEMAYTCGRAASPTGATVTVPAVPASQFTCADNGVNNGMYSIHYQACVNTRFPDCASMYRYCPLLNGTQDTAFFRSELLSRHKLIKTFGKLNRKGAFEPHDFYKPDPDFQCPDSFGAFPVGEHLQEYRVCIGNHAFAGRCEEGEFFDPKQQNCIEKYEKPVDMDTDINCAGRVDGMYGVDSNCKYFQVCCGDNGYIVKCPLGNYYDVEDQECVPFFSATCSGTE